MIRHIVAMRFRDGIAPVTKAAIYRDLAALSGHLKGILDFRSFANVSPETAVVHGFGDLFWFDFADAAARDAYLADPAHKAVGARIVAATEGGADGVLVLDVEL
jgi:hypothetical protein